MRWGTASWPNHEGVEMPATSVSNSPDSPRGAGLEIIFSSRDGYVWASWPNGDSTRLGQHEVVAEMMRHFLAQDDLGKRLARHYPGAR